MNSYYFSLIAISSVACGGPPNPPTSRPALHIAAQGGDVDKIESLLAASPESIDARDESGQTALHAAALARAPSAAHALLAHGAKADVVDRQQNTPLHIAAGALNEPVVRVLLTHKASPKVQNARGETPLLRAVMAGVVGKSTDAQKTIVKLLLDGGAVAQVVDGTGIAALHAAAMTGRAELLDLLVHGPAGVELPDSVGRTPLHHAAAAGQVRAIEWLLAHHAKSNSADKLGQTPLHAAAARFRAAAMEKLLSAGAQVNARSSDGATPLLLLSSQGPDDPEVDSLAARAALVLIEHGAQVNVPNARQRTPLDEAVHQHHPLLADVLRRHGATQGSTSSSPIDPALIPHTRDPSPADHGGHHSAAGEPSSRENGP